jgi:hypothetical protein
MFSSSFIRCSKLENLARVIWSASSALHALSRTDSDSASCASLSIPLTASANRQRKDVTARRSSALRQSIEPFDPSVIHYACKTDLAAVVDTWPKLPEAIKAGIVEMVKAASK